MDLSIDPNTSLAELQTKLFMAAITALVELARTTDQDHIKLRALTEVARLCNPAKTLAAPPLSEPPPQKPILPKPLPSPRRGGSSGSHPAADLPLDSAPAKAPDAHVTAEHALDHAPGPE